jgi:hypothetical protein
MMVGMVMAVMVLVDAHEARPLARRNVLPERMADCQTVKGISQAAKI